MNNFNLSSDEKITRYPSFKIVNDLESIIDVMQLGMVGHSLCGEKSSMFVLLNSFIIPKLMEMVNKLELDIDE